MIGKRLSFALLASTLLAGTFIASPPASAGDDCDRGYRRRGHYHGHYRRARYHRARYHRVRRYHRAHWHRPRRARYYRSYSYYRPVRRYHHGGYHCGGCGSRFSSRRWLAYHRRASCG